MLQNEICPIFLNRHVIKHLLGRGVRWTDLAFFDPIMFESLRKLVVDAETSVDPATMFASLDLTFAVEIPQDEVHNFLDGKSRAVLHNIMLRVVVAFREVVRTT